MKFEDAVKAKVYEAIAESYEWLADGCAHEWRYADTLGHTIRYCDRCRLQKLCYCPNDSCTDGHICGGAPR